jgi:predicted permease
MEFVALLGCFAAPTAISSFVMTQQMGGDAELAGDIVVLTSALSPATIFLWAFLFRTLGAY